MRGGFVERTLRDLPMPPFDHPRFPLWIRLIRCAAIVDVKDSRFENRPWQPDDVDDGINYRAAYRTWRQEYETMLTEPSYAPPTIDTHTHGEVPPGGSLVNPLTEHGLLTLAETLPDGYHLHTDGPLNVICGVDHEREWK